MSAWPKSPMLQDARLQRAIEMGVIIPGQDPEAASAILDMLGLGDLKKSLSEDKKQVARELDRWRAAKTPQEIAPPELDVIEPAIHLFLKKQFLKQETVEDLKVENPAVYQAMLAHVQALKTAMMPPAPVDPQAAAGDPVADAVHAGALVPEGSDAGPGDPVGDAVAAGALQPEIPGGNEGPSMDDLVAAGVLSPAPQEAPGR